MPLTKAEVYAQLIARGVAQEFFVVPEYRVKPSFEGDKREIDLAWCIQDPNRPNGRPWLPVAVFEIEGHDVELRKPGKSNGIEKDADSILSAARFVRAQTNRDVMPAAAVVLFQLAADGERHYSRMIPSIVASHQQRFAAHAAQLYQKHAHVLPAGAAHLGANHVLLDDGLYGRLNELTESAMVVAHGILAG